MSEEPSVWVCHKMAPDGKECGNTVLSVNRPTSLPWDDGHRCFYTKEVPNGVEETRNG